MELKCINGEKDVLTFKVNPKCRGNNTQEHLFTLEEIQVAETHDSSMEIKDDEKGVLRCNGRIPGYKPIFLPRSHHLAKLIIEQSHKKTLPEGVSMTMSDVRR